jgi:hypothetical protein
MSNKIGSALKSGVALGLAAGVFALAVAPAQAGDGGAIAAGIIGGTALGVLAGTALAAPPASAAALLRAGLCAAAAVLV